jgi:hypothetical protein
VHQRSSFFIFFSSEVPNGFVKPDGAGVAQKSAGLADLCGVCCPDFRSLWRFHLLATHL